VVGLFIYMSSFRPSNYKGKLLTRLDEGGSESTFDTTPSTAKDDTTLTTAKIGDFIVITVNPGADNEEKISASAVSVSGTTATWTIVNRGLSFTENASVTANKKQHAIGETVIISNDDHFIAQQIVDIDSAQTITGMKTVSTPTADGHIATKAYADSVGAGGTVLKDQLVEEGDAGETVVAGNLVYFDTTDNEWKLCDANTAATLNNVKLGIAQGAGTDGNTISGGVLTLGLDKNQTEMTAGDEMYASDTAGAIASSAGTTTRVIGIARTATELYFDPNYAYIPTDNEKDAMAGGGDLGTPSSSNKFVTERMVSSVQFGGDGSDGVLDTSSGSVEIDLGGEQVVIKNYTSINVVTNNVTFTNPHANGTIVIFKSQGDATISATINLTGVGAEGGAAATAGKTGVSFAGGSAVGGGAGGNAGLDGSAAGSAGSAGSAINSDFINFYTKEDWKVARGTIVVQAGSGGGGGGAGTVGGSGAAGTGATGGRGGGAFILQVAGALDFSGTINASGNNGSNSSNVGSESTNTAAAGGAGGGGSAGQVVVIYNELTANTGTINTAGGNGGTAGTATANSDGSTEDAAGGGGGGGGGSYGGAGGAGGAGARTTGNSASNGSGGGSVTSNNGAGGGGGGGGAAPNSIATGGGGGGGGTSDGLLIAENIGI
jgi:ribosomal protein L14